MDCYRCSKPAKYVTQRDDRALDSPFNGERHWCLEHFTEKVTRYPLKVRRIGKN